MVRELTLRKLGLLKILYKHAVYHSSTDSKLDNMLAIHHFDLCNEFLLRILGDELHLDIDKLVTFENIYNCIAKNLKNKSPDELKSLELKFKPELMRIRKLRNDIQHHGEYKTFDDVKICFANTKDFLETTIKEGYGLEFEDINLAMLIEDAGLKENMLNAFQLIKQEQYLKALEIIEFCFEKRIKTLMENGYIPSTHSLLGFTTAFSQQFDLRVDDVRFYSFHSDIKELDELRHAIEKVQENVKKVSEKVLELVDKKFENYTEGLMNEIAIMGLGINYMDYSAYRNIVLHSRLHQKLNKEDVNYCFDFVTEILIRPSQPVSPTSPIRYRVVPLSEFL
mgnify:CR=1 FL=1